MAEPYFIVLTSSTLQLLYLSLASCSTASRLIPFDLELDQQLPYSTHGSIFGILWVASVIHAATDFDRWAEHTHSLYVSLFILRSKITNVAYAWMKPTSKFEAFFGAQGRCTRCPVCVLPTIWASCYELDIPLSKRQQHAILQGNPLE